MKIDLLIATAIFVLGVIVAVDSYQYLLLNERPDTPFDRIPRGETHYTLTSHGQCILSAKLEATFDGSYEITLEADVHGKLGERDFTGIARSVLAFNSLGQLGSGFVRFEAFGEKLFLRLEDVNPFRFEIYTIKADKRETLFERYFPGPVELIEQGDYFRLQYRALGDLRSGRIDPRSNPLVQSLQLKLEESAEELPCDGRFDFTPYVQLLRGIQGNSLFGGAS